MQIKRTIECYDATPVHPGLRVLLLSNAGEDSQIVRRLASLGGQLDVVDKLFAANSEVINDPAGYALFVVDCDTDGVGGLENAQRAVMMMDDLMSRVPIILVSQECVSQHFPTERLKPTVLRAPLSAVSMKVAFEHALRDRIAYQVG